MQIKKTVAVIALGSLLFVAACQSESERKAQESQEAVENAKAHAAQAISEAQGAAAEAAKAVESAASQAAAEMEKAFEAQKEEGSGE